MKIIQHFIFIIKIIEILSNYSSLLSHVTQHCDEVSDEQDIISDCISSILQQYQFREKQLILILRDLDFDVSIISKKTAARILKMDQSDVKFEKYTGVTVVPSSRDLNDLLSNIIWTKNTRFLIFLPRFNQTDKFYIEDVIYQKTGFKKILTDDDLRNDLMNDILPRNEDFRLLIKNQTETILKQFWNKRILNAVVVVPQKTNVYFYSYFPYAEHNCPDRIVPVLFNIWQSTRLKFYKNFNLYPDKALNLHKCPVNVSLVISPPGIIYDDGDIGGIEGKIITEILNSLNGTPVYHFVNLEKTKVNESFSAMNRVLTDIDTGVSEMGAGLLIPSMRKVADVDYTNFFVTVCLTWVAPNRAKYKDSIKQITDIFTLELWICILLIVALSSVIFWTLLRPKRFTSSTFQIIAAFLGKNTKFPNCNPPRVLLMFFIWYSLVLNTAFQAGMGSNNMILDSTSQLETIDDVINSKLEIVGVDSTIELFNSSYKLKRLNGDTVHMRPMNIKDALRKVAYERKKAYIGLRLSIRYHATILYPDLRSRLYIPNRCLFQYHPFLALRKNSPFTTRITEIMFRIIEGGFKEKSLKKFQHKMWLTERKRMISSLNDMALARGALMILTYGLGVSFIVFLGELIFYYSRRLVVKR